MHLIYGEQWLLDGLAETMLGNEIGFSGWSPGVGIEDPTISMLSGILVTTVHGTVGAAVIALCENDVRAETWLLDTTRPNVKLLRVPQTGKASRVQDVFDGLAGLGLWDAPPRSRMKVQLRDGVGYTHLMARPGATAVFSGVVDDMEHNPTFRDVFLLYDRELFDGRLSTTVAWPTADDGAMSWVQCWPIESEFIAYPSGGRGHALIVCTACGQVHAANLLRETYSGVGLEQKLRSSPCAGCGAVLAETWAPYPENYVRPDGSIGHIDRPAQPSKDSEWVPCVYPEIYEPVRPAGPRGSGPNGDVPDRQG